MILTVTDSLRTNGVIRAENPVRTAVESGRIEELSDDDDE